MSIIIDVIKEINKIEIGVQFKKETIARSLGLKRHAMQYSFNLLLLSNKIRAGIDDYSQFIRLELIDENPPEKRGSGHHQKIKKDIKPSVYNDLLNSCFTVIT